MTQPEIRSFEQEDTQAFEIDWAVLDESFGRPLSEEAIVGIVPPVPEGIEWQPAFLSPLEESQYARQQSVAAYREILRSELAGEPVSARLRATYDYWAGLADSKLTQHVRERQASLPGFWRRLVSGLGPK